MINYVYSLPPKRTPVRPVKTNFVFSARTCDRFMVRVKFTMMEMRVSIMMLAGC